MKVYIMACRQKRYFLSIIFFGIISIGAFYGVRLWMNAQPQEQAPGMVITTIHGDHSITDPLIIDLINTPAMQRLKKIRQYGTIDYVVKHTVEYNRFEHSLGVYYILWKHGASRIEQVAGLLHDVSHTVFSHACDPLFMGGLTQGAYQDMIHDEFLTNHGIKEVLEKYGFTVEDVSPKKDIFKALEQDAPALCADRIEYNIFAAYMDNLLSIQEIQQIHQDLHFDGSHWYFDTIESAKKCALVPLHQTMYMWGSPLSILCAQWTCQAFKRALEIQLVTQEDICFNITDDEMWALLNASTDPVIQKALYSIKNAPALFSWVNQERDQEHNHVLILKSKYRGIDPFVKQDGQLVLLSSVDADFKRDSLMAQEIMRNGWHVVLHDQPNSMYNGYDVVCVSSCNALYDPRLACASATLLEKNNSARALVI
jgi:uncharacterized protein